MKRRSSHSRWIRKILALLLLSFCTASLVLMQTNYGHITMLSSLVSHEAVDQKPKIAFLFIARNRLPLDLVWDAFFKGEKESRFSIYVHSRPGFLFNKDTTRSAYFYGRQVNNSIQVDWGESSMIEAERILLRNALKDPFNERFAFVSDSCIPLYNFSYIYDYIMSTSTSYLDRLARVATMFKSNIQGSNSMWYAGSSFADTKEGRYNPKMHPIIPVHNWRKGSQWAVLVRKHAKTMVDDDIVFPEFQKHCRRRSLPEFWRDQPIPANAWKEHNCIPDEHYVQTLLARRGLEEEITRRPLTHTSWDLSSSRDKERRGWHPVTYKLSDATPTLMETIKGIDNIYFETEYRREWCTKREQPAPCFLFARKFTRAAALRLLNLSMLALN
ncbi:Glycosyl transferase family 14 protein [Dioscorea alata]|uniref:Glycosyl transferase family 14 protein n=1 Tax=Dioscorea alata TaxID=55571 RepID=A0ACB7UF40_DIOAL|nr:Glycosyl transferase family 14 protein [Dioscorea alata]